MLQRPASGTDASMMRLVHVRREKQLEVRAGAAVVVVAVVAAAEDGEAVERRNQSGIGARTQ